MRKNFINSNHFDSCRMLVFAEGPLITKNPAGGGAVTVRIIDGLVRNQGVGSFTVCVAGTLFTYCSGLFTNTVPCTVVVPFA